MKITSEQLKELLERATKGPWEVHESQTNNGRLSLEVGTKHEGGAHWCVADMVAPQSTIAKHNAALIALTPDLAAEVIALRELLVRFSGCSTCRYGNTEKKRPAICDACVKEGAGMYYLWELDPALTDSEQIDETMKRR